MMMRPSVQLKRVVVTLNTWRGCSVIVSLGSVVMPVKRSEALNTSRHRKMMKEAACATNFMKGLRSTVPSCRDKQQVRPRYSAINSLIIY